MFLKGKINSVRYIAQVVTPCYCHFFDRKVICYFSAGQTTSTYSCCDETCSSWCTTNVLAIKNPRSHSNWTCMGHDEAGTFFLHCLAQPWPLDNGYKMLRTIYRRITFGTFMSACMREYKPALSPKGLHCVLMWLFGYPLLWLECFIWSEFVMHWVSSLFNPGVVALHFVTWVDAWATYVAQFSIKFLGR